MKKSGKIAVIASVTIVLLLVFAIVVAKPGGRARKACNDGIDNDDDTYTDYPDDPGCSGKNDNSELNPSIECDDGNDNDGDNNIDYPDDAGCSSPTDNDETNCGDSVCEGGEVCDVCIADCGYCDSCSDTDGGNYPLIFGTASGYLNGIPYSDDDYCVDSGNILEYYCAGDYEQSQQQSCGTDYYSDNYCNSSDVYRDYTDYFCLIGECDSTTTPELVEDCDYGCTNGTCDLPPDSCSDIDGGYVPEIQGTIIGNSGGEPYNNTDYCMNSTSLMEYYCSGTDPQNYPFDCALNFTSCSNGACVF
jgi:hypothetical protein